MNGVLETIERLGSECTGDVPALIASARTVVADDVALSRACDQAASRRAQAGDRGAVWWLACAIATLRASPLASAQEDAELNAARALGEISRSPAAIAPLPPAARWLVAGHAEPPPVAHAIELARKNATTYVERLDAELEGRERLLLAKWQQAGTSDTRSAIEEALDTYANALSLARAALSRVIDHVAAKSGDPAIAESGARALAELDDVTLPSLRSRIENARRALFGTPEAPPPAVPMTEGRLSFAGAAPPSFQVGTPAPPVVEAPRTVEQLDAAMRAAFERAWAGGESERAAFEAAVRARYEQETASIPDPDARQQALDHYVAHALAQLPAR
jgi:hypothetical protein